MRDNERVNDIDLAALQLARRARMMEYEMQAEAWERKSHRADLLWYALILLSIVAATVLVTGVELKWW
ncbi:MAG: hypothetical protein MRJ68_19385 [Nitrospira sp.]|nr:hypothetical protein [Nitrospira sp.]